MNDQEFLDQYKRDLDDSLPVGEPELEMTPEFIEELWQHAVAELERRQDQRKARRMSLVRRSLSAAAGVALLVGIGMQLWQPPKEDRLSACPRMAGILPAPAAHAEEIIPDQETMPRTQRTPYEMAQATLPAESDVAGETPAILGQAGSPSSQPSLQPEAAPSAIRLISEAEYYDLLCSLLPDEPEPSAPDLPAAPLSAPDTLPSFYQPTLRDYLGNLARRIVCDRMPYLCSAE